MNKKNVEEKKGYVNMPLIKKINYTDCMPDILHMVLRITDKFDYLFQKELDILVSKHSKNLRPNFEKWTKVLKEDIGLYNVLYTKDGILILRDLRGGEKVKILTEISKRKSDYLVNLFPEVHNVQNIQKLWTDFLEVVTLIKENIINYEHIKTLTKIWKNLFIEVYSVSTLTPYMHIFTHHLWWFYKECNFLNNYNMEGAEKLNDIIKNLFPKATNKKKYILQIMEKQNRCEYLRLLLDGE